MRYICTISGLLERHGLQLPEKWATMRPEQLKPAQFIDLTIDIFGARGSESSNAALLVSPVPLINGAENKNLAKVQQNAARSAESAKNNTGAENIAVVKEEKGPSKRLLEAIKTRRDRKIEASRTDGDADNLGVVSAMEGSTTTAEEADKKGVDKSMYISDAVWRKALYG